MRPFTSCWASICAHCSQNTAVDAIAWCVTVPSNAGKVRKSSRAWARASEADAGVERGNGVELHLREEDPGRPG